VNDCCTWQVFWLAPVEHLPIPPNRDSGMKIQLPWSKKINRRLFTIDHSRLTKKLYSYGDSAGIEPDFPFNPAMREPNTLQM
jgi:hypothetical protein